MTVQQLSILIAGILSQFLDYRGREVMTIIPPLDFGKADAGTPRLLLNYVTRYLGILAQMS
jgi:hypothetical protein